MKNFLTAEERTGLITRHKRERDKRVCDRIKVVLACDRGYSYSEIAELLLLDVETIRRHLKDYQSDKKLKPCNGGSLSALSDENGKKLIAHLEEKIYLYVKEICAYVKRAFNIKYSISGMTQWLKAHGFCYKKPHGVPAKADREKQEAFLSTYVELKKNSGKDEEIYFADSVHPEHQTRLAFGWIKKGERKPVAKTACQRRMNIMGGISLRNHQFVYKSCDKVNGDSICEFLKALGNKHKDGRIIHLILDNAGYHRSKKVVSYAESLNIKIHYLPPYSPNLNPIERMWKLLHEQVTYNRYYASFKDFTDAVHGFLKSIGRKKKILRARINDNFHLFENMHFAS